MFVVALAHGWTFSYEPFRRITDGSAIPCYACLCCLCCCCSVTKNLGHVVSQDDLIEESKDALNMEDVSDSLTDFGHKSIQRGSSMLSNISLLRQKEEDGVEVGGPEDTVQEHQEEFGGSAGRDGVFSEYSNSFV